MIRFVLNGKMHGTGNISPTMTLLDFIRSQTNLTGTKEGCAEGDCGACTVVRVRDNKFEAVNSCLLQLGQLSGFEIVTVEGLEKINDGRLIPIQKTMVEEGGTQCGFCTPGFVMALFALGQSGENINDDVIHDALAGNLCRCTGYKPIVESARKGCENRIDYKLAPMVLTPEKYEFNDQTFFLPKTLKDLASLRASLKDAMLLSGGTDLGLLVSKERIIPKTVISTAHVSELQEVKETKKELILGSAVSYTSSLKFINRLYPSLGQLISRIGSRQIRNIGTIGGNIGTASPIGDTLPALIALNAIVTLFSLEEEREIRLEDFLVGYRKTCLKNGEVIKNIKIPKLTKNEYFKSYKVSKRYDQDISSVVGAYRLKIQASKISDIHIIYGGLAEKPSRAIKTELSLRQKQWNEDIVCDSAKNIPNDFTPISDHRASSSYRLRVASNLLVRLHRDITGEEDASGVVKVS
tara:strand:+ start:5888 stop:7285 length:1398 start_codon:yes stop_codon:yes gene_type:complete